MTENYDVMYDIAMAMSKLPWNRNYKIYRNGTVILDIWKLDNENPKLDQKITVMKDLNMFIQMGIKGGMGCHILTRVKDIDQAQRLLDQDIKEDSIVFDSKVDNLDDKLVAVHVFISTDIKSTNDLINVITKTTKMVVDNYNKSSESDKKSNVKYKLWEKYGLRVDVYKVSSKELEDIEAEKPENVHKIYSKNRADKRYNKTVVLAYEPEFIGDMPNTEKLNRITY